MKKTIVVIPTYNEIEALPVIVEKLQVVIPSINILVVDDNSPDGTGDWADKEAKKNTGVSVLHRTSKDGLGKAYLDGFEWCLKNGYEYIVEMDADLSHRPQDLPKLLDKAYSDPTIDLVIGSRWVKGGATQNWSYIRILLSKLGSVWSRFWLRLKVRDITAGFRVYSKDALTKKIDLSKIDAKGFGFQIDMTFNLALAGGKIVEVPIVFVERTLGESKISNNIVTEALFMVAKKGIKNIFTKRKRVK